MANSREKSIFKVQTIVDLAGLDEKEYYHFNLLLNKGANVKMDKNSADLFISILEKKSKEAIQTIKASIESPSKKSL